MTTNSVSNSSLEFNLTVLILIDIKLKTRLMLAINKSLVFISVPGYIWKTTDHIVLGRDGVYPKALTAQ